MSKSNETELSPAARAMISPAVQALIRAGANPGDKEAFDDFMREMKILLPDSKLPDEEAREFTRKLSYEELCELFPPRRKKR